MKHSDVIKTLIDAGADVRHRDVNGQTAMTQAILNSDARTLSILLAVSVDKRHHDCGRVQVEHVDMPNSVFQILHCPPIMLAVYVGNVDCIELLLKHGEKLNILGEDYDWRWCWLYGRIETFSAAKWEEILMLIWRVEGQLDSNLLSSIFWKHDSAILRRILDRRIPVLMSRRDHKADYSWMVKAAVRCEDPDILSVLMEYKTEYELDVGNATSEGPTLLQIICGNCSNVDMVRCLLEHGADVNQYSSIGWAKNHTPLYRCVQAMFHMDTAMHVLLILLQYGSDLDIKCPISDATTIKYTPLQYSLTSHNLYAAEALVLAGARLYEEASTESVDIPQVPEVVRCSDDELDLFIDTKLKSPITLELLCRKPIRKALKNDASKKLDMLPLTKVLKEFLDYNDICYIAQTYRARLRNSPISHKQY